MSARFTIDELTRFLATVFPQMGEHFTITALSDRTASVEMRVDERHLRPGGTVSGPTMFNLADAAFYIAVLAALGPEALAVTTSCSINFMRKPEPTGLRADARILKLGKTLAVGDVLIHCDGADGPVAHATITYSIPPKGS